ncbi:MAG: Bro-N domain-containing protein [Dehalococcoidales bacterium]|nr:Bro-N domain-containing protein [Dehalococcoidales bacterium]
MQANKELILFQGNNIRIERDKDGNPGFCLQDICEALGIKKPRNVISRLSGKEAFLTGVLTPGGMQQMWFVNEIGLYQVVTGSRKAWAKDLTKVITEALPGLRKNGDMERIAELEARIAKLERGGGHLLTTIPAISPRSQLNMIIRKFVARQTGGYSYPDAWHELYYQNYYRYGVDLKARARRRKVDPLDCATPEELGNLVILAHHIFRAAE